MSPFQGLVIFQQDGDRPVADGDASDALVEQFLLQFCHGCPSLEQPPKAEGFILLRPDGVQLEGCQLKGQTFGLCLIHRRAVQELVQPPAQLLHLWRWLILQHGAGDALRVLDQADFVKTTAVFLMLFIFIAILCFAAVIVIAYTRSMTLALASAQVYEDLRKLGASGAYLRRCIRGQLSRVWGVPIAIGTVLILA